MTDGWQRTALRGRVEYDRQSFMIDGKRVFIHSAAIHYFRFPREEWRDVLVQAKLAGINCIDMYFAWNFHEEQEGEWDFSGDKDCGAFMRLCAELGLWIIARPGPFICAEWDFGGLPWWLNRKEGIRYREWNAPFLTYVDMYFDRLIPMIAENQLDKGGSVILVQVENEYQHKASDEVGKPYLDYLRDGLIRRGIETPLISCEGGVEGAVEAANFWTGADNRLAKLKVKQPDTPKIVAEFWTGWFEHWGSAAATQKTPALLERRLMEVIRAGFSGLNHYMFCGGTNFGDWGGRTVGDGDIFMVTSYDYDAPLNEYLEITPKYQAVKRIGYWLEAMQDFLLTADEVGELAFTSSTPCRLRAKGQDRQYLYFVEHDEEERKTLRITCHGRTFDVTVGPRQIVPVLHGLHLTPVISMSYNAWIGGYRKVGGADVLVLYAEPGQRSKLELTGNQEWTYDERLTIQHNWSEDRHCISFDFCHFRTPQFLHLTCGDRELRVIVLDRDTMDRSWWLNQGGEWQFVIGADRIELKENGEYRIGIKRSPARLKLFGKLSFAEEGNGWYGNEEEGCLEKVCLIDGTAQQPPLLNQWTTCPENLDSAVPVNKSAGPIGFSQAGHGFGYLVYSTEFDSADERETTLVFTSIQDPASLYVNGVEAAFIRDMFAAAVRVKLRPGCNRLQLLSQNMGRYNFSCFLGEAKGLQGEVIRDGFAQNLLRNWRHPAGGTLHLDEAVDADLKEPLTRTFILDSRYDRTLLVGAVGAVLRVNGVAVDLGAYIGWYKYHSIDITDYVKPGENKIEMKASGSPLGRLELLHYSSSLTLEGWETAPVTSASEMTWETCPQKSGRGPAWFRCEFARPELGERMKATGIRIRMTGMGKGTIHLNGKNLGRYWQIGPQEDYKAPWSWLQPQNELVLFDEEGRLPNSVELILAEPIVFVES